MQRKTLSLCVLFLTCFALSGFSQSKEKIDLSLTNVTLKEFFSTVEKKLGYSFMYSNVDIDDNKQISINEKSGTIRSLLDKAFKNLPIKYEITANKIVLTKADTIVPLQSSQKKVKGKIVDDTGEPIIGASVVVKGTTKGTVTDIDGDFDLEATPGETLLISYVGFEKQEIKIGNQTTFDIKLKEDSKILDEVVVIGYGTLKKSDLTGTLSSVDTKDLVTKATSNPVEALQGVVAGVNIQKNSGLAGAGASVKIRGVSTFGDNEPLYIIDGFPGSITSVNPNDIESMEILKDGAAAAIYGSVAANGVIIVTTKSGKQGKIQVDINSYASITSTAKRLELLDANGYITVHKRMYDEYNKYASKPATLPDYLSNPGTNDTNWQDEVFRTGFSTTQSVAVRGGQDNTRYSLSTNITNEKGIVISNTFTQQNARMKISTKKNIFSIDGNLAFTATKSRAPRFSLKETYMISPLVPVYDANEEGGFALTNWGGIPNNVNVIADDHYKNNWTKSQEIAANIAVGADIYKGLTFKTSYSYRGNNEQYYFHRPAYTSDVKNVYEYPFYRERRLYWDEQVFDNLLNYSNKFDKHSVNAMLGTSLTLTSSSWNMVDVEGKKTVYSVNNGNIITNEVAEGFSDPYFMTIGAGRGGTFSADGTKYNYNRMSYFGRINYSFDSKYLFQFTLRRDGSSKFGKDSRYGNFPSVALGWRINEEAFFPENTPVSNLKLRASWGKLGNEVALGYYDHQALISTSNSLYMGYVQGSGNPWPGSSATGLENRLLKWEVTVSKNIGLDYGFLNNQITGTINYYNNTTEDLLITKKMAPSSGLDDPILNVGKMRNSGLEFEFNYSKNSGDFKYNLGMNLSTLNNKMISLADEDQILYGDGLKFGTEHFPNQTRVGRPIGAFYLYKTAGIFQNESEVSAHVNKNGELLQSNAKPGDIRFVDINGDGTIDDDDKEYCGTGMPKVEVNLNLGASYKGFDAMALIGSGWGHKLYNGNRYFYESMSSGSNFLASTLNSWTPQNTNTDIPRAVLQDPNGNSRESDRFLESGDFIRLRQVQLGYTLPRKLLNSMKLENLRIYVSGENLLTWTKYDGIDPEFAPSSDSDKSKSLNTGVDRYIFPFTRSYVFGLQVTF
ncbi:TonB-dependent receptor [Dysgonomonas sp. Marseille-P4677]|uniref:TonB-dependent receptor n=1 Tax=Dysgonomonas sp. Marseille-P4677 TaxID=2364790 RepID=UPI0019114CE6|nr:TonB-dependent receptor [Dysgonomonas sp. Marseille-P4677]MBK5720730.1 TonB-dependent receptor [Dysgonomonas sp. Marseille-P4677]